MHAGCDGETSQYVRQNQRSLDALYVSCPFIIVATDVPSNDLGVASNARNVIAAARGLGAPDPTVYEAALATSVTLTGVGAAARVSVGVFVRIAFDIPTTQAATPRIQTTGATTAFGATTINRDVTFQLKRGCQTIEAFLLFASPSSTAVQIWSPRVDVSTPASKTIVVSGLPSSGSGTVTGQWVGVDSQYLESAAGAIFHS